MEARSKPTVEDVLELESLDTKIRALLPEQYLDTYEDVLPVSMGSAGLKYDADGRVAWNDMWATFCDLAMAGGPPHRGALLEPSDSANDKQIENEIARGITLVTGLEIVPQSGDCRNGGWIGVRCRSMGMAGWLVRAIVMENIMARHDRDVLYLPVGPDFRLAKEIKNVITVIAKTCHYWTEHMPPEQQQSIDKLFTNADAESELIQPALLQDVQANPETYRELVAALAHEITARTGRTCFANRYVGWIGVECPSDRAAIWLMRAMVVDNILARREGDVLFLPVTNRITRLLDTFERAHRLRAIAQ